MSREIISMQSEWKITGEKGIKDEIAWNFIDFTGAYFKLIAHRWELLEKSVWKSLKLSF